MKPVKLNLQDPFIKKQLLYLVAVLVAFLSGVVALDKINTKVDEDLSQYKEAYKATKNL